jgi:hypothetical protein
LQTGAKKQVSQRRLGSKLIGARLTAGKRDMKTKAHQPKPLSRPKPWKQYLDKGFV